mmetsp:Transcript_91393/g.295607  ORF Transcript_91393/g.295607 Transcript_91393/m.295607 type:complete len:292 (+) Transcript_91393:1783-2658(+)
MPRSKLRSASNRSPNSRAAERGDLRSSAKARELQPTSTRCCTHCQCRPSTASLSALRPWLSVAAKACCKPAAGNHPREGLSASNAGGRPLGLFPPSRAAGRRSCESSCCTRLRAMTACASPPKSRLMDSVAVAAALGGPLEPLVVAKGTAPGSNGTCIAVEAARHLAVRKPGAQTLSLHTMPRPACDNNIAGRMMRATPPFPPLSGNHVPSSCRTSSIWHLMLSSLALSTCCPDGPAGGPKRNTKDSLGARTPTNPSTLRRRMPRATSCTAPPCAGSTQKGTKSSPSPANM